MAETEVLRPSRKRSFFLLLLCGGFVALLVWLPEIEAWKRWLGLALFGAGCLGAIVLLVSRRFRLEIGEEGLTQVTLRRAHFHRWEDCSRFEVLKLRYGFTMLTKMVVFTARVRNGKGGSRNRDLALSNHYGMTMETLARRLNVARERRLDALRFPDPGPHAVSTRTLGVSSSDRIGPALRR